MAAADAQTDSQTKGAPGADARRQALRARLDEIDVAMKERRYQTGLKMCDALLADYPNQPGALLKRGVFLAQLRRPLDALISFERSAALGGMGASHHYNLAGLKNDLGRFPEARAHLEEALRINPKFHVVYQAYARSKKFEPDEAKALLDQINAELKSKDIDTDAQAELHFAAAKLYDDIQDPKKAWSHAKKGNEARARDYDRERKEREFEETLTQFTPERMEALGGHGAQTRQTFVFIVGMPRSSTTLTEQVLSAAGAFGAGERPDLHAIAGKLAHDLGAPWPDFVEKLEPEILPAVGQAYARAVGGANPRAQVIVDKCPTNFRDLGLARLMLPDAKFVWCRRDPLDTCLSCYMQDFNEQAYTFDLDNLAFVYGWHEKLMRHWQDVAGPVFEWRYEEALDDFEHWARGLLEHVGLPWTDEALEFQNSRRRVSTASNWQVRQPLFKTSRGRADQYKRQLAPLKRALKKYGVAVD